MQVNEQVGQNTQEQTQFPEGKCEPEGVQTPETDNPRSWINRKMNVDFSSMYNTRTGIKGDDGKALNQSEFWAIFGVTQSGGSRYESGRSLPKPVRTLLTLLHLDVIRPCDLIRAGSYLKRCNKSTKEA